MADVITVPPMSKVPIYFDNLEVGEAVNFRATLITNFNKINEYLNGYDADTGGGGENRGIVISENQPLTQRVGDIWYKIVK